MQWFESGVYVLFPPFVAGVLYGPVVATLDILDLWKGWWIPPWIARRVPSAVLPNATAVLRTGGFLRAAVRSSPAVLQQHWWRGLRRIGGLHVWATLFAFVPTVLLGMLALAGLIITVHPGASSDPEFARENTLPFFSLSAGLASAAVLWFYRSRRLYRRRVGESLPLTSAVYLARLLASCWKAAQGSLTLLQLDRQLTSYTNRLGWFAAYGVDRERRRTALRPHLAGVQQALETEMSNVLRYGIGALPGLARLLATLLDRSVQGRWMGLLDEADLPRNTEALITVGEDNNDRWVVLAGSAAAAVIVTAAVAAGLPAAAVAPAALTALIGPAVMWGSGKLGSSREHLQTMTGPLGTTAAEPAAEPPPSSDARLLSSGEGSG
ncbi:hypothetical protein [Streptomyces sp. NPDC059786]|uniref:hypothetical protein n=1 Tax=Streptomyces sp. NPDC059786 TaxID=3346946 RepID=UPI003669954F